MARIVGGFVMPHDPLVLAAPELVKDERRQEVMNGFSRVAERIRALQADTAIIVGADHYMIFGPHCLPQFAIGIGEVEGPIDRIPNLERARLPVNPALATHVFEHGRARGFDWAVAKYLDADHSVLLPYQLSVKPAGELAVIPVYVASGVEPLLPKARAYALGQAIGEAVAAFPGNERVVIIGSGGISHWVGLPQMGKVNEAFDRRVLEAVTRGNAGQLVDLPDAEILEQGGNGALEIRNFLVAMGAVRNSAGAVLAYAAVPEWITGLGFAELSAA